MSIIANHKIHPFFSEHDKIDGMGRNGNDFSQQVKDILAKRVGTLCSNPTCCAPTFGPRSENTKSINIGVAAHIEGAAHGAARYNPTQSSEERSSIENGMWLCQKCAKLIDNDSTKYTVSLLKHWKEKAEERAHKALETPKIISYSFVDSYSLVLICRQKSTKMPIPQNINGNIGAPITIKPILAPHDLIDMQTPIVFGLPLSANQVLFTVAYQNIGVQIEEKIKIKISFGRFSIAKISIANERMQIIEGGLQGSSYVTFYISESLPNESQSAQIIISTDQFPEVSFWTNHMHESKEIFIYDIIF